MEKRLFIALAMPSSIVEYLENLQDVVQKKELFSGRFVSPKTFHLTLKFLGSVPDSLIPLLIEKLATVHQGICYAKLGKLGIFSRHGKPSIFFLDLLSEQISTLACQIDRALSDYFPCETCPFKNHVTIARITYIIKKSELIDFINNAELPCLNITFTHYILYESVIIEQKHHYNALYCFPLI